MAGPGLLLGDVVPPGGDACPAPRDGELDRHHQDVQRDVEAGLSCVAHQLELRGVGAHRLGDERLAGGHEVAAGAGGQRGRVVGVRRRRRGPVAGCDLVGVDDVRGRPRGTDDETDERRLAGAVGPDDQVEPAHPSTMGEDVPSGW